MSLELVSLALIKMSIHSPPDEGRVVAADVYKRPSRRSIAPFTSGTKVSPIQCVYLHMAVNVESLYHNCSYIQCTGMCQSVVVVCVGVSQSRTPWKLQS